MNIARTCFLLLSVALVGCATPRLQHAELGKVVDDDKELTMTDVEDLSGVTYYATGSLLRITEELDDAQQPIGRFTATSLPVPAGERIYAVYPRNGTWWKGEFTRTYVGAGYMPNTRILSSLGVQVRDDRKQFVTALGSVVAAVGAAGVALDSDAAQADPGVRSKPVFPLVVDVSTDLDSIDGAKRRQKNDVRLVCDAVTVKKDKKGAVQVPKPECGTITYGPLPIDAVLRDSYLAVFKDKLTDTFPVPACRSASIQLNRWDAVQALGAGGLAMSWPAVAGVNLNTVVSDPKYVRVVRVPPTGSIAFHTSCGADVLAGDIATDPIWAAIAELGAQAKAIKDAKDGGGK